MISRLIMKNIIFIMIFISIAFMIESDTEACDVAVVSAAASSTGRPVIWKSRDNAESYREEVKYYPQVNASAGGSIRVMGEVLANSDPVCSAGVNEAGFAICNTTVYESDSRELANKNTDMMVNALEQCTNLSQFEDIVELWADKTLSGNFAVMDAHGGAALYEIWTDGGSSLHMKRYNASTYGFVNRTNSHTWDQQTSDSSRELRGRQIFHALYSHNIGTVLGTHKDRLGALIYDDLDDIQLNYRTVMQLIAKDVCYGNCTTYDDYGIDAGCNDDSRSSMNNCGSNFWGDYSDIKNNCSSDLDDNSKYQTRFCISRYQTQFSFVVEGVNEGDDPGLVTAWICLGEPSFSVSTPHFAAAGQITPYAINDQYYTGSAWQTATGSNTWNSSIYPQTRSNDDYSFLNLAFNWLEYPNSEFLYSNNGFNLLDYGGSYNTDRTMKFSNLIPTQNWSIPIETYLLGKYESFKSYMTSNPEEVTPENLYNFSHKCAEYAYKNYIQRSSSSFHWTYEWDTLPPSVELVTPAENATDVSLSENITAKFSEAIDSLTINGNTFRVNDGTSDISGNIDYDDDPSSRTAAFDPSIDLYYNNTYTATITTGAEDISGNGLDEAKAWSFTTRSMISSVTPADESAVSPPSQITIVFSVPMTDTTINTSNIRLYNNTISAYVNGSISYDSGTKTATFIPSEPLLYDLHFTIEAGTGVKDSGGTGLKNQYSSTFNTNNSPSVTATSVSDGQTSVPVSASFNVTFSEPMDSDTINEKNITLNNDDLGVSVSGSVKYTPHSRTATFNPRDSLEHLTSYTLKICTGVKDVGGNNMLLEEIRSFTTAAAGEPGDEDPPAIQSSSLPPDNSVIQAPEFIAVVFNEAMDPGTINTDTILLYNVDTGQYVEGSVVYNAETNTITFTPDAPLEGNTGYTFTIKQDVSDINGNNLSEDIDWTFSTIPDGDDDDDDIHKQNNSGGGGCGCGAAANASVPGGNAALANIMNVFANMALPLLLLLLKRMIGRRRKK